MLPKMESDLLAARGTSTRIPQRLVFLPMGYGVNGENWFPSVDQAGHAVRLAPIVGVLQGPEVRFLDRSKLDQSADGESARRLAELSELCQFGKEG